MDLEAVHDVLDLYLWLRYQALGFFFFWGGGCFLHIYCLYSASEPGLYPSKNDGLGAH